MIHLTTAEISPSMPCHAPEETMHRSTDNLA